jgi:predicted nucleotidyltransferase
VCWTQRWNGFVPERSTIDIPTPAGGWGQPWPSVVEIEHVFPHERWTLVGGLMTQLHCVLAGFSPVRPTNDVDMVLHIETERGLPAAARALESLGYKLVVSIDPRERTAHRFRRQGSAVDLVTSGDDLVDILTADHAAPSVRERLQGRHMIAIEGGTQALRRTVNARLVVDDEPITLSVPSPLAAVILKAAAYRADSRNPERHLQDAAALLACIPDPYEACETMQGSDGQRLRLLAAALPDGAQAWRLLDDARRADAQIALRIMTA